MTVQISQVTFSFYREIKKGWKCSPPSFLRTN